MATHKDLIVWQKAIQFVLLVYRYTQSFPKEEIYGITGQMRRAAVSIPSNIAEAHGRYSEKELLHFLHIAIASSAELETQILISYQLQFLQEAEYKELLSLNEEITKMLASLIRSKKNKNDKN
ncbi:MAG: four helix bundle protein [Bacteroidales bacterium]|jgi:four helix bundle protein|nr:four helix bundle protein [Bacteroidales bacterium]